VFEEDLDSIHSFIQEHYSPSLCWGDFKPWLRWYRENKLLGYIKIDGQIRGVGMVRFVHSTEQAIKDAYYNDPFADICWVELIIAPDPKDLARLIDLLLTVWGERPKFAARRNHLGGVIKEYPFSVMSRLAFKGLTQLLSATKHTVKP
jgi:hypothetical protein